MRATAELTGVCVLASVDEALPQDEDEQPLAAAILTEHTRIHHGWRVSYRKQAYAEELNDPSKTRQRLHLKTRKFGDLAKTMTTSLRLSPKGPRVVAIEHKQHVQRVRRAIAKRKRTELAKKLP